MKYHPLQCSLAMPYCIRTLLATQKLQLISLMDISLLSVWQEIYTVTLPLKLLRKFKFNQLFSTKVWDVIKAGKSQAGGRRRHKMGFQFILEMEKRGNFNSKPTDKKESSPFRQVGLFVLGGFFFFCHYTGGCPHEGQQHRLSFQKGKWEARPF